MRFASRTDWPRIESAYSLALAAARHDPTLIDLTTSNPTGVGLVGQAPLTAALRDPAIGAYHPEARGPGAVRDAIARYYGRRSIEVDPANVIVTASSSEAYAYVFRLLCEPDDAVLAPLPSYPLFEYLTGLADVRRRPYRWRYDGSWYLDRSTLEPAALTQAILLVSPNNPTGNVCTTDDEAHVREVAEAHDLAIVSDEVFADWGVSHRAASWIDRSPSLTFSLNGLSKIAGLPQLKLGWIVVGGPRADEALARLEIIADTYLSVSTPALVAAPPILDSVDTWQDELRGRLVENRQRIADTLTGSPCTLRSGGGGWSAMIDLPATQNDEAWALGLLAEKKLAVQPGFLFDLDVGACVVVSTLVPPPRLKEGLERLLTYVDSMI